MAHIESGVLRTKGQVFTGTSKDGNIWKRQDILLEREFQNSVRHISFSAFNNAVDALANIKEGDNVDVTFFPISREYKGKWYTECRVSAVAKHSNQETTSAPTPAPTPSPQPTPAPETTESLEPQEEDLPF